MSTAFFAGLHHTLTAIAVASRVLDKVKNSDEGTTGDQSRSQGQGTLLPHQRLRLTFRRNGSIDEFIAALLKGHQPSLNYLLQNLSQLGNSHLKQICKALAHATLKGASIAENVLTQLYHTADTAKQTTVIAATVLEESRTLHDKIINNPLAAPASTSEPMNSVQFHR